jgi:hypothetical protein
MKTVCFSSNVARLQQVFKKSQSLSSKQTVQSDSPYSFMYFPRSYKSSVRFILFPAISSFCNCAGNGAGPVGSWCVKIRDISTSEVCNSVRAQLCDQHKQERTQFDSQSSYLVSSFKSFIFLLSCSRWMLAWYLEIIIIIIIYLFTAIGFAPGGSGPYTTQWVYHGYLLLI